MAAFRKPSPALAIGVLALMLASFGAGWGVEKLYGTGNKAAIERVVHDYLLEHPEVLPEAVERLRQREMAKQLASLSPALSAPYPGAVLGNPKGTRTLVEFTDFACTFCRHSVADVDALIAADPQLRVVIRELPILTPQSADAARMALAAADQGRYPAFHHAMFAAGRLNSQTIAAAAAAAGMDIARARKTIADPRTEAELARNIDFARQLGISGTPAWIAGNTMLSGAVGREALAQAIKGQQG